MEYLRHYIVTTVPLIWEVLTVKNIALAATLAIPLAIFIHSRPENVIIYQAEAKEVPVQIEVHINWTKERIEQEIRTVFPEQPELMLKVAKCESRLNPNAYNPTNGSHDGGIFQISEKYHGKALNLMGLDAYDIQDNLKYARILYDKNGLSDWTASAKCWR